AEWASPEQLGRLAVTKAIIPNHLDSLLGPADGKRQQRHLALRTPLHPRLERTMTAATLLALALMTGELPCRECSADERPFRPRFYYRNACDGGKCLSCRRPLFGGDGAPPFDYRLV